MYEYDGFESTCTWEILSMSVVAQFSSKTKLSFSYYKPSGRNNTFILKLRKNKSNEPRVTAESNWRTRVNLKHRTPARTRNCSRFYCLNYIDSCSTFREQRIALLQLLFKMHRKGPAVLHFSVDSEGTEATWRASPVSVPSALVNHVWYFLTALSCWKLLAWDQGNW